MSCVLRAHSPTFDVDAFLHASRWKPTAVHRAGEPASKRLGRVRKSSGFNLEISNGRFADFDAALPEVLDFLERERDEVARLVAAVGDGNVEIDFALDYDVERTPFVSRRIPVGLMEAAVAAGVDVRLSAYPVSRERDAKK